MTLPKNKTKIVCTIGPASESPEVMEQMIRAGMNVARLNFSHGDFDSHQTVIENLRGISQKLKSELTIMGDLPGPKLRIGQLAEEPVELKRDDPFSLTNENVIGNHKRVSVSFSRLPKVVHHGDKLYINDWPGRRVPLYFIGRPCIDDLPFGRQMDSIILILRDLILTTGSERIG